MIVSELLEKFRSEIISEFLIKYTDRDIIKNRPHENLNGFLKYLINNNIIKVNTIMNFMLRHEYAILVKLNGKTKTDIIFYLCDKYKIKERWCRYILKRK